MRQKKLVLGWSKQTFIGLVTVAVLAPSAWAYVNGGDFHSTLGRYEKQLKTGGWGVSSASPMPEGGGRPQEIVTGVTASAPDSPEYQRWVNVLVGRALQSLPEKDAAKVPLETKREVARLAREAIHNAVASKQQVIKKGQTGSLQYQVGAYEFESYWETKYGGKREIHARRTGLAPFVALKIVDAKDQGKQ